METSIWTTLKFFTRYLPPLSVSSNYVLLLIFCFWEARNSTVLILFSYSNRLSSSCIGIAIR